MVEQRAVFKLQRLDLLAVGGFITGVVFGWIYNWMSAGTGGVEVVLTRESADAA